MDNNSIKHAGVKGMRWGVRRYQNKDGSLTPAGKKRYSEQERQADRMRSMSDDELRRVTNRLRAENDYIRAKNDHITLTAKKKSAGRKFVEEVLMNSGKDIAKNYITKFATSEIDKLLGKAAAKKTKS